MGLRTLEVTVEATGLRIVGGEQKSASAQKFSAYCELIIVASLAML